MAKFTKQQLSDQMYNMGTALLECSIHLDLRTEDLKVFKSKKVGVYYLVGNETNDKGLPTITYFKKDFNK